MHAIPADAHLRGIEQVGIRERKTKPMGTVAAENRKRGCKTTGNVAVDSARAGRVEGLN